MISTAHLNVSHFQMISRGRKHLKVRTPIPIVRRHGSQACLIYGKLRGRLGDIDVSQHDDKELVSINKKG